MKQKTSRITNCDSEKVTQKHVLPKIEIASSQFLGTRVMSRTRSADKTTQLNHSYSLKCEFILSSTRGIAQLLHSDSLLMTGRMKVRGTNPAKGTPIH
jgi:hypothetical protein